MNPIAWLFGRALRYLLSFLIGGLMNLSDRAGLRAKLRLSNGWPTTEARIESRQLVRDPKGKEVVCRLGYSYVVNGEYYAGFFERLFSSDALATDFLRQIKDGQRFTVRYKARGPQKSVIDPVALKQLTTPVLARQTAAAPPDFQQPMMGPNPADFKISTDKVDGEIAATATGVLREIKMFEGTTVSVNSVVGTIAVAREVATVPMMPAPRGGPAPITDLEPQRAEVVDKAEQERLERTDSPGDKFTSQVDESRGPRSVQKLDLLENIGSGLGDHDAKLH